MMFLLAFFLNPYTFSALLAGLVSSFGVRLLAQDAAWKRRMVRAGLTSLLVTPWLVALVHLLTTWSWTLLVLKYDWRSEFTLYHWTPALVLHMGADLASTFLPATWSPSGVVGGLFGAGAGFLAGMKHSRRSQWATGVNSRRFPRRALMLGGPLALALLAAPGVAVILLRSRIAFRSSPPPPHSLTPGPTPIPSLVQVVGLSPDGRRVAFGGESRALQVWDINQQTPLFTCQSQAPLIQDVAWSSDGKYLASCGGPVLDLWDAKDGALITLYPGPANSFLFPLGWSPDSKTLAVSDHWVGRLQIWRVADGASLYTCDGMGLSWSPDGRYLASGSAVGSPGVVWVRDAPTGQVLFTYRGFFQSGAESGLDLLAWSPDSKRIASGGSQYATLHIWDALDGGNVKQYPMDEEITALIWLPDSGLLVTGNTNEGVKSWDPVNGQTVRIYQPTNQNLASRVWTLACTPDGKYLAAGSDNRVRVWDAHSGKLLFQIHTAVG